MMKEGTIEYQEIRYAEFSNIPSADLILASDLLYNSKGEGLLTGYCVRVLERALSSGAYPSERTVGGLETPWAAYRELITGIANKNEVFLTQKLDLFIF